MKRVKKFTYTSDDYGIMWAVDRLHKRTEEELTDEEKAGYYLVKIETSAADVQAYRRGCKRQYKEVAKAVKIYKHLQKNNFDNGYLTHQLKKIENERSALGDCYNFLIKAARDLRETLKKKEEFERKE